MNRVSKFTPQTGIAKPVRIRTDAEIAKTLSLLASIAIDPRFNMTVDELKQIGFLDRFEKDQPFILVIAVQNFFVEQNNVLYRNAKTLLKYAPKSLIIVGNDKDWINAVMSAHYEDYDPTRPCTPLTRLINIERERMKMANIWKKGTNASHDGGPHLGIFDAENNKDDIATGLEVLYLQSCASWRRDDDRFGPRRKELEAALKDQKKLEEFGIMRSVDIPNPPPGESLSTIDKAKFRKLAITPTGSNTGHDGLLPYVERFHRKFLRHSDLIERALIMAIKGDANGITMISEPK